MGLFDKLFGKADAVSEKIMDTQPGVIYAPISGNYIELEQIPEEVFAKGILGPGCGIDVTEGLVVSPVNGTVLSVADTSHAIGISSEEGAEFLIHVGMDTVEMNGDGFEVDCTAAEGAFAGKKLSELWTQHPDDQYAGQLSMQGNMISVKYL